MTSILETIQSLLRPLAERLDGIAKEHQYLFEECKNFKRAPTESNKLSITVFYLDETKIHSVSRNRIKTVTSPLNRTIQKQALLSSKNTIKKFTSPQPIKTKIPERPITAFTKNKVQRKPLAPLNNTKTVIPTSPRNNIPKSMTPKKLVAKPINQTNHKNQKGVRPKIKSQAASKKVLILTNHLPELSDVEKPIQIIECIEPILQLPTEDDHKVQNEEKQNAINPFFLIPKVQKVLTLQTTQQITISFPKNPISNNKEIIQSNFKIQLQQISIAPKAEQIIQQFQPHHIQDIKLQNIHSSQSVEEKTEKLIQESKLQCSIVQGHQDLFISFVENPPSNQNLTDNYLEAPTSDQVL